MNAHKLLNVAATVIVVVAFTAGEVLAQQQFQQDVQLQQVLRQPNGQMQLGNGQLAFLNVAAPLGNFVEGGITADESTAVNDLMHQFLTALEKDAGDNELAATFNFEEGTITRHKRGAKPEVLKFDPQGDQTLRQWLTLQMPPKVLRDWMKGGIYPHKDPKGRIFVRMTPSNIIGPVHTFEFEKQQDTYRIRAIVSNNGGC